jgi:putative ABC transport system substrate-binding protein
VGAAADKRPTIGFLGADVAGWRPWTDAFVARLRELGWIEGRTIAIEYRWTEGRPERVAEIAAEFVRRKVDVVVTNGPSVATLKQATSIIPIVFAVAKDPVATFDPVVSLNVAGRRLRAPSLRFAGDIDLHVHP